MRVMLPSLLATLLLANGAQAQTPVPVTPAEQALADSSLKLTAILRITGLTCQGRDGKTLFSTYQLFTQNNGSLLKSYQTDLLTAYRQQHIKDPDKALHARETELNNKQSVIAAKTGTQEFCLSNVPKLQSAAVASQPEIQRMVAALVAAK